MMKVVRPLLVWLVVIAAGYFAFKFLYPLFLPEQENQDTQTTVIKRGDLRKVVPADGILVPSTLVEVKSKASGVVEVIMVEPGDVIQAGDILVELDKEEILARQRQSEADVAAAEAQLTLTSRSLSPQQKASRESSIRNATIAYEAALTSYERVLELHGKGYATDQELDDAQRSLDNATESLNSAREQLALDLDGAEPEQIEMAQASLLRQKAALDNVNEELANTTIRAPIDGTVLTRPVELGTAVASGTSGNTGGTVVATIGDLSTMFVEARIDETDLDQIEEGTSCRITFDAFTGWVWNGKVLKIYPQGEAAQTGTQFPVDIEIDLESGRQESESFSGMWGMAMGMGGRPGGGMMARGGGSRPGGGGAPGGGPPAGMQHPEGAEEGAPGEGKPDGERKKPEVKAPQLYSQLTASVEVVLDDHPGVLILDARYIKYDNGKPYVEVLTDPEDESSIERRDVTLGFTDGLRHEVVSGLEDGETLILKRPMEVNGRR